MKPHGFTLLELLVTITVLTLVVTIGLPTFTKQISESRTRTATMTLLDAIEKTRAAAVFRNQHAVLVPVNNKWHEGWTLFVDKNRNGALDDDEETISINQGLDAVISDANSVLKNYVAFIGTGEGRQVGPNGSGGFLSGTIKICPVVQGEGYSLVLSKAGRTRVGRLTNAECDAIR